jgi:hypothetical protein
MRHLNKKYWPYRLKTESLKLNHDDAYIWCRENLPGRERWILAGPNNWYFKNEKDKTLFLLRWS